MDSHAKTLAYSVPKLKARPSEHVTGGRLFVSFEAAEQVLPAVARVIGDSQLVYASDYPHFDAEFQAVDILVAREDLTSIQKRKFLGENALRLFPRLN